MHFSSHLWSYLCMHISFWCELKSFGDISRTDVCFLYSIMELDCTQFVCSKCQKKKKTFNSNVSLVTQYKKNDLVVSSFMYHFLFTQLHSTGRRTCVSTHGRSVLLTYCEL